MLKRILVGIADATYTAASTRHAIEIASRCGASLSGVAILDLARARSEAPSIPMVSGPSTKRLEAATVREAQHSIEKAIDVFVRLCEAADVPFEYRKLQADPLDEFVARSKYADLVVCGLSRLFEHGVLPEPKDELEQLVRSGVHPMLATVDQHRPLHRVLIGYSNSVESARTLRRFAQLYPVLSPQAEVKIVHCGKKQNEGSSSLLEARDYVAAHGIAAEIQFLDESPRTGVLQHAEHWNADLLVIGNSAKSLLRRKVFGETALHTMKNADRPLFLAQ